MHEVTETDPELASSISICRQSSVHSCRYRAANTRRVESHSSIHELVRKPVPVVAIAVTRGSLLALARKCDSVLRRVSQRCDPSLVNFEKHSCTSQFQSLCQPIRMARIC